MVLDILRGENRPAGGDVADDRDDDRVGPVRQDSGGPAQDAYVASRLRSFNVAGCFEGIQILADASWGPEAPERLHLADRGWDTLARLETDEAVQKVELLSGKPSGLRLLSHGTIIYPYDPVAKSERAG